MEALSHSQSTALSLLKDDPDEELLWNAIAAFQGYPFFTASGLPFTYRIKRGRNGAYTKELLIDRRERSKSLTWGSIRLAFAHALESQNQLILRPKMLGDIRGISYIYPLLWRFELIQVPEAVRRKLCGQLENEPEQMSFY